MGEGISKLSKLSDIPTFPSCFFGVENSNSSSLREYLATDSLEFKAGLLTMILNWLPMEFSSRRLCFISEEAPVCFCLNVVYEDW